MRFAIATGGSRKDITWKNKEITWDAFLGKVSNTYRTHETMAEYRSMPKRKQDDIKDVGGFVGGSLKDGRRRKGYLKNRSMLTLDMDYAQPDIWDYITMFFDFTCCVYSTHKHKPDKPRLRLVIPLSRPVTADEYGAVARKVVEDIGIEQFDDTTYEPTRLMYWASTSADGEYLFKEQAGALLDPDQVLSQYDNWKDSSQWPVSSRQKELVKRNISKQADPLGKEGVIGAFCRTYCIQDAIEKFVSDVYKPGELPNRYDYISADSTAGVVVYDDKFVYSHHATDPACGKLCNAFDIVRLHKYSELDDEAKTGAPTVKMPSYIAMKKFALQQPEIKKRLVDERKVACKADFAEGDDTWKEKLIFNQKGELTNKLANLVLILQNDPNLKSICFNKLVDGMEKMDKTLWDKEDATKWWRDADDAQLMTYIDQNYGSFTLQNYNLAVTKVTDDRAYHPIREYLDHLPEWDKVLRLDALFIDYFAAEDCDYTRAITRKVFTAAVARIYKPGVKFDWMLVLNGATGIGKSTLIQRLAGEWFSDSLKLSDTQDKTAAEKLQGYWIIEIGELAGMRKAEENILKQFLSSQNDVYRASFGKRATPHPRQCVFIGTTNEERGYLRDTTGNRRFWPLKVSSTNKKPWHMPDEDVLQIWAEAKMRFQSGEPLQLSEELERYAAKVQEEAMELDDRQGVIEDYLEMLLPDHWDSMELSERREYVGEYHNADSLVAKGTKERNTVSVIEIWCEAFGKNKADLERFKSFEITKMIRRIGGWKVAKKLISGGIYGRRMVFVNERNKIIK